MVLGLLIGAELLALAVAIFAVLYDLHLAILTLAVVAFLVCGHFVRVQLTRRGVWADQQEAAKAGASAPATHTDDPDAGGAGDAAGGDTPQGEADSRSG